MAEFHIFYKKVMATHKFIVMHKKVRRHTQYTIPPKIEFLFDMPNTCIPHSYRLFDLSSIYTNFVVAFLESLYSV